MSKMKDNFKEFLLDGEIQKLIIVFYNNLSVQNLEFARAILRIIITKNNNIAINIIKDIFDEKRLKELYTHHSKFLKP